MVFPWREKNFAIAPECHRDLILDTRYHDRLLFRVNGNPLTR